MFLDGNGNIAFFTDAAPNNAIATGQLCKSRIEAQRGEMKYAADSGMPTAQTAFNTFNPKQFEAAARAIITNTPNVTGVESFSMYSNANVLNYSTVIDTVYGQTTITGLAGQL
jgi:hypothetical protein